MPNETTGDAPLSAPIGEQLEEKRVLDEELSAEREAVEDEAEKMERHKAAERAEVARHMGQEAAPGRWRSLREALRARGRRTAWLRDNATLLALPLAAAGGLVLGLLAGPKKKGFPFAGAAFAAWLLLRRRRLPAG